MRGVLQYNEAELYDLILEKIPKLYVLGQVAWACGVNRDTFHGWIKRGDEEAKEKLDTPLSRLSKGVRKTQAAAVESLLEEVRSRGNGTNQKWILEKCFREDFGQDSAEIQELRGQIAYALAAIGEHNLKKGAYSNGRKMTVEEAQKAKESKKPKDSK